MKSPLKQRSRRLLVWLAVTIAGSAAFAAETLFDGKTLNGWEGDPKWWSVEDGMITGGSRTEKVPRNFFLATTRQFQNFDLKLKLKLTEGSNHGTEERPDGTYDNPRCSNPNEPDRPGR